MKFLTAIDSSVLFDALRPKRRESLFLLFLSVLETTVLTFGIGLVYPVVAQIVGGGIATSSNEHVNMLMRLVPQSLGVGESFALIVSVFALKSGVSFLRIWMLKRLTESLRVLWASRVAEEWYRKKLSIHHAKRDGDKLGAIVREPKLAAMCIVQSLTYFVSFLSVASMLSLSLYVSWQATLGFLIVGGGFAVLFRFALMRKIKILGMERLAANHRLFAEVMETLVAIKDVKALALESAMRRKMNKASQRLADATIRSQIYTQIPSLFSDLIAISTLFAFIYYQLITNNYDVNAILPQTAVFFAVIVKLFTSGSQLIASRATVISNIASLDHILSVISRDAVAEELEDADKGVGIKSIDTSIKLDRVSFGYKQDADILKAVSIEFKKGEVTYIIGASGAGKSTLVDIILRYYEPTAGRVLVNGRDYREFNLREWRRLIGYVGQDALLFSGTIRENITLGEKSLSDESVIRAARLAGAYDFIEALPHGFDTVVGEKGVTLSGGQRIRVAIARVVARSPELVIIDEGTARFELSLEHDMVKALRRLPSAPVIIVITHRHESTNFGDNLIDFDALTQ